ncbi:MAG: SEC-C metal-binding domain-containing protein [Pseudomonadota bacterium]
MAGEKLGRNDACPCGSGRKYKRCCLLKGKDDPYARPTAVPTPPRRAPKEQQPWGPDPWDDEEDWEDDEGPEATFQNSSFTWEQAEAIASGAIPGDPPVHPWVVAQLRERTEIGPGGATPVHTIGSVRALDDEALWALLAGQGVALDPAAFMAAAEGESSAWALSRRWSAAEDADRELIGLVTCELWRRLRPAHPSLELLDERIQEGFDRLDEDDLDACCAIWLAVVTDLLACLPPDVDDLVVAHAMFPGLTTLSDWLFELDEVCVVLPDDDGTLVRAAEDAYRRLAERFSQGEDHIALSLQRARLLYALDEVAPAESLIEELRRAHPDHSGPYAMLADRVIEAPHHAARADLQRAVALLEEGLSRCTREDDIADLTWRLEEARAALRAR